MVVSQNDSIAVSRDMGPLSIFRANDPLGLQVSYGGVKLCRCRQQFISMSVNQSSGFHSGILKKEGTPAKIRLYNPVSRGWR